MQEDMTSPEALQEEKPVELTEMFIQKKKTVTLGDTMTLQAILCVLIAIGFVTVNIFNGSLAAEIFDIYKEKLCADGNIIETIVSVADFLSTAPINNV